MKVKLKRRPKLYMINKNLNLIFFSLVLYAFFYTWVSNSWELDREQFTIHFKVNFHKWYQVFLNKISFANCDFYFIDMTLLVVKQN